MIFKHYGKIDSDSLPSIYQLFVMKTEVNGRQRNVRCDLRCKEKDTLISSLCVMYDYSNYSRTGAGHGAAAFAVDL